MNKFSEVEITPIGGPDASIKSYKSYYYLALFFGLIFHGVILFFTHDKTYDAYVHMFFASHYAESWFESWNYQWYTGFTITSYPPLVHQYVALVSKLIGLKLAFISWGFIISLIFIRGAYHFARLLVHEKAATYTAFAAVFSFSFLEALHIFGQLPSITGIAFVLNACPEVYKFFRHKKWFFFFTGISMLAVTTSAHHVSTIFGAVFFIAPIMALAMMDRCADIYGGIKSFGVSEFVKEVMKNLPRAIFFGSVLIFIVLFVIWPYWAWSKSDPITQVSIPHGSRENFLENTNLGIVFFLIPWGLMSFILPYFFIKLFNRRTIFLALSFTLAFILGTGGTTPIPKMILGEHAFNILTLDRFTFWATLMALPFWGLFIYELFEGDFKKKIYKYFGAKMHGIVLIGFALLMFISTVLIVNMAYFRPLQPKPIEIKPIANFLKSDNHDSWRYLTLGFGDQVAWLSANTDALTVDGNYHSARRLPELTTRPVERLENAKYLGMSGLGALHQFLTIPEKYHLKYIFSNDKFYDPLLYFSGWEKVVVLDNFIVVWEKPDVPPLPGLLPKKNIPKYQRLIWGIMPLTCLFLMILFNLFGRIYYSDNDILVRIDKEQLFQNIAAKWTHKYIWWITGLFFLISSSVFFYSCMKSYLENKEQLTPENALYAYYDHLDFRRFEAAHALIEKESRPEMAQFMLELTIEDGLLASFAKLDSLLILDKNIISGDQVEFKVKANWITSIMSYQTEHKHVFVRNKNKWFLQHESYEQSTPPDQFFAKAKIFFVNQGRRAADVNNTDKRDVLDRPELYINSANLIKFNNSYSVVGDIQNVDDVPAYLTVEAVLYDSLDREILRYNARDILVHHILPKEVSPFRIDFEEIAWQKSFAAIPEKFDPELSIPFEFQNKPTKFVLFVKAMASDYNLNKDIGIQNIEQVNNSLKGTLKNAGSEQINIPLLLASFYTKDKKLLWVDKQFQKMGIRPQRKKSFDFDLIDLNDIEIVFEGTDKELFANGVSRKDYRSRIEQNNFDSDWEELFVINNSKAQYCRLLVNGFID